MRLLRRCLNFFFFRESPNATAPVSPFAPENSPPDCFLNAARPLRVRIPPPNSIKNIPAAAEMPACRKSSFRQAVRLSRMCLNFVFFRASLYKSTAARKKRKTQMPRNHQVSGHFIKKIKICLQMINKKLFSDITKRNVSLRRGSGALSTV